MFLRFIFSNFIFADEPDAQTLNFGRIDPRFSKPLIQTGWLNGDTLVEIKLFENAVNIWKKKHLNKTTFVKMTPVDVNQFNQRGSLGGGGGSLDLGDEQSIDICEAREKSRAWPIINVAV